MCVGWLPSIGAGQAIKDFGSIGTGQRKKMFSWDLRSAFVHSWLRVIVHFVGEQAAFKAHTNKFTDNKVLNVRVSEDMTKELAH